MSRPDRRRSLPAPKGDKDETASILLNGARSASVSRSSASLYSSYAPSSRSSSVSLASTNDCSPARSPRVSFILPPQPSPQLRRRRSIELGVAARKNILQQQGTAPLPSPTVGVGANGYRTLYMTDEEWEEYKKQYASSANEPIDLGELAIHGAKSLWKFVRTSSSSSLRSTDASPSRSTPERSSSPRKGFFRRNRSTSSSLKSVIEETQKQHNKIRFHMDPDSPSERQGPGDRQQAPDWQTNREAYKENKALDRRFRINPDSPVEASGGGDWPERGRTQTRDYLSVEAESEDEGAVTPKRNASPRPPVLTLEDDHGRITQMNENHDHSTIKRVQANTVHISRGREHGPKPTAVLGFDSRMYHAHSKHERRAPSM